mmetsp:Transcript_13039/g.40167  ORF Transcript_13039/g.40167 Transcript_13039/m.40167 type:complete len:446 (+) Transcript_13039:368-1705(+)
MADSGAMEAGEGVVEQDGNADVEAEKDPELVIEKADENDKQDENQKHHDMQLAEGVMGVESALPDGGVHVEHSESLQVPVEHHHSHGEDDQVVGHGMGVSNGLEAQGTVDDGMQQAMDDGYSDDKDDSRRKRKRGTSEGGDSKSGDQKVGRYVVNDVAYNSRGYQVCGYQNQRGTLCGRIGVCPFHSKKAEDPESRRYSEPAKETADKQMGEYHGVMRLSEPPQKKKFKQSWTQDEHQKFLDALRRFGKGNWKKIAEAVGSRTANQCQSHAQKFFLRQKIPQDQRKKKSIHDAPDNLAGANPDDPTGMHRFTQLAQNAGGNGVTAVPIVLPLGGLQPGGVQALQMGMGGQMMPIDQLQAALSGAMGPQKMRVTVHRNGEAHGGKAIIVPTTMDQFFRLAAEKLNEKGFCRAFTRSGGEISNLDELCHDDSIWLSDGAEFIFPPAP